jgi:hypothetical protein
MDQISQNSIYYYSLVACGQRKSTTGPLTAHDRQRPDLSQLLIGRFVACGGGRRRPRLVRRASDQAGKQPGVLSVIINLKF